MSNLYLAPPIFFAIALIFSMLGMGGSQLYIPILYWVGMDFKAEAIPLGMLLNVVNSASAAVTYARHGLINWRVAVPFGITMIVLAPVGAWLNVEVPVAPLMIMFALFTACAALLMLSGWKPERGELSPRGRVILGLSAGSILGLVAGLIGRGGGSFVVPLLYIAGLDPQTAAATSALVVSCSGFSSFLSHLASAASPNWGIWGLSALCVLAGSQLGSRFMSTHLDSKHLKTVFGVVLLMVAALILKDVKGL